MAGVIAIGPDSTALALLKSLIIQSLFSFVFSHLTALPDLRKSGALFSYS
jgi:hypothetical protein